MAGIVTAGQHGAGFTVGGLPRPGGEDSGIPAHIGGMSNLPTALPAAKSSSVRGDLARYDNEQRVLAASRGKAALKMAAASVPCRDSVDPTGQTATFFWVRSGELVCGKPHGDIQTATPTLIADAVMKVGETAVALSSDVTRRIVRMMGTLPAWSKADTDDMLRLRQAQRLVAFYSTLPVSSHLITLTQALDAKFYAPVGVDTSGVIGWRELFGEPKTVSGLGSLLARVYASGVDPKQYGNKQSDPAWSILRAEQTAEKQSEYGGASGKASLLSCAEAISEGWSGMIRTDRIARRRGVIDGTVCRITPTKRNGAKIRAAVSAPFKIKEGDLIVMDDDAQSDRIGYASLASITVENDELVAEFAPMSDPVKRNVGSFSMLDGALAAHTSMLVTAKPFLGGGRAVFAGTWGRPVDPATAPIKRTVPLDVTLAGIRTAS